MTRDEKNHKISEWLNGPWDESRCRICGWTLADDAMNGCVPGNCSLRPAPNRRADDPADYYASEEANARLLEKMPAVRLLYYPEAKTWECSPSWTTTDPLSEDPDRKTAIADAFLAWIEQNPKR